MSGLGARKTPTENEPCRSPSRAFGRAGCPCARSRRARRNDLFGTTKAERRGQGHPSKGHAGHSDYLAPAPPRDALALDRPLPDGALKVVARGDRTGDAPGETLATLIRRSESHHPPNG